MPAWLFVREQMVLVKILTAILISTGFLFLGCLRNSSSTTNKVVTSPLPTPEDPSQLSQEEYTAMLAVIHDGPIVLTTKTDPTVARADVSSLAKELTGLPVDAIEDFKRKN